MKTDFGTEFNPAATVVTLAVATLVTAAFFASLNAFYERQDQKSRGR